MGCAVLLADTPEGSGLPRAKIPTLRGMTVSWLAPQHGSAGKRVPGQPVYTERHCEHLGTAATLGSKVRAICRPILSDTILLGKFPVLRGRDPPRAHPLIDMASRWNACDRGKGNEEKIKACRVKIRSSPSSSTISTMAWSFYRGTVDFVNQRW